MIEIDQSRFDEAVIAASHERLVLVDFWAPWCGPCRMLGPILEQVERDQPDRMTLVKINSDDNPEISARYAVRSIPFVMAFRDGDAVDQFVGALPQSQVQAFVDALLPGPADEQIKQGLEQLDAGQFSSAATNLSAALASKPDDLSLRLATARALAQSGAVDDARVVLDPVAAQASHDKQVANISLFVESAEAAALNSAQLADATPAAYAQDARLALLSGDWPGVMANSLELVQADRHFENDLGRRLMLVAFELAGEPALVSQYRRQLASALN